MAGRAAKAARVVPAIHVLLNWRMAGGWVYFMTNYFMTKSAQRHSLCRRHEQLTAARFSTSRGTRPGIHKKLRLEEAGLLRTFRRYSQCHSAREKHQALAVEG